jgi:hypothetical protein
MLRILLSGLLVVLNPTGATPFSLIHYRSLEVHGQYSALILSGADATLDGPDDFC